MKKVLTVLGVIIIAVSLYVTINEFNVDYDFYHNLGTFTGLVIFLIIGSVLIYFGNKQKAETKEEKEAKSERKSYHKKLYSVEQLYEKGLLTKEEYEDKVRVLKSENREQAIKNTKEYKMLKDLKDNGLLSVNEFKQKVKQIKL